MITLYIILSALGGSGLTVAIVNTWGKIKIKRIDSSLTERQQFIKELNELRDSVTKLYERQYNLMEENVTLKAKVKELEDHVNKKSVLLNELTKYKNTYSKLKELVENTDESVSPLGFFFSVKSIVDELSSS